MATPGTWWVIASTSYGGPPSYIYFQGTQAQAQARAGSVTEVSGQQNLFGPYDTKAGAEQAVKGKGPDPVTAPTPGGGSNPLAPFADTAHALTAFYAVITNGKLWRSLGWLLLGILLMLAGLGWWLKGATPIGQITSALKGS